MQTTALRDTCALPISGRFRLDVRRNGVLIEQIDEPNLVVTGARFILAGLLSGSLASPGLGQIGYGSNILAPVFGNSTLATPYLRPLDPAPTGAAAALPGTANFAFSLPGGEGNGLSIAEFGLFSPGGVLFARKTRRTAPIVKDATVALTGTWLIVF